MGKQKVLSVIGANVHNLKNLSIDIPLNQMTVITGLSGSGKSSLAFDTIHAEGQRRYIESFSAYARRFLGNIERPEVDKITGLSPVISIEQKTVNKNPRSTVGTITEIYAFLRLLYARASTAYSQKTGEKMISYTDEQMIDKIKSQFENKPVYILAPIVKARKGHYEDLFVKIRKKGFIEVRVDGEIMDLVPGMKLSRYKNHDIEVVIDKIKVPDASETNTKLTNRIKSSIQLAISQGDGVFMVIEKGEDKAYYFSKKLMCPSTGLSYPVPDPNNFSFNSSKGACSKCKGLGRISMLDTDSIFPDKELSIYEGGIAPLGKYRSNRLFALLEVIMESFDCSLKTSIDKLPEEAINIILYGSNKRFRLKQTSGVEGGFEMFPGIVSYLEDLAEEKSKKVQKWLENFVNKQDCPECKGARIQPVFLNFKIKEKNIAELAQMSIQELSEFFTGIEEHLSEKEQKIADSIIKEIRKRINFILDVGLGYLSLNRSSKTLSGGESQRIRLATQIGSQLVNVLYILDEPSIGLHQRDNFKLINSLKQLNRMGNTIIVVEHDKDIMLESDYIIDIGPKAGINGGEVVAAGTPSEFLKQNSITAQYLSNKKTVDDVYEYAEGNNKSLKLFGAKGNNLKGVDVEFPLGKMICITGVSGSGKSTLINETLHPILSQKFYKSVKTPLPYEKIEGVENLDKVIVVNQSPIGRTPRSNAATYTGLFSDIRAVFQELPESKIRGYKAGRFSFNVKGGRCEECSGAGVKAIEMNLLPDVYVKCDVCNGKRYNRETLEVRYKGKSIGDVLDMTIEQACDFFEAHPVINRKLSALRDVGLGYIHLGQSATTLSGGEAQRVKLATELSKKDTGNTLYILDEPTTGLHFEDIRVLLKIFNKLTSRGNTIIVIEHNMDIIKNSDYIIDIGPEGGNKGGKVVFQGEVKNLLKCKKSHTGVFLQKEIDDSKK